MPIAVKSVRLLQEYVRGVMKRADHHAQGVGEVVLALVGGVLWCAEGELEVFGIDGDLKNVLWFGVSGQRYAISYQHEQAAIEIRQGSTQGDVLHSFDNSSTLTEIKRFFAAL